MSTAVKRYFRIYAGSGPTYWTVAKDQAHALKNIVNAMINDGASDEISELEVQEMSEDEALKLRVVDDMLPEHANGNMTMLDMDDVLCTEYP